MASELYPDNFVPETISTPEICPVCKEELTIDDCIYINAVGEVVGCSLCVKCVGVDRYDKD